MAGYDQPGFRARRALNSGSLVVVHAGLTMCRANCGLAAPALAPQLAFDRALAGKILAAWSLAFCIGLLVNALLTDRIGGRRALLIAVAGTIVANALFGLVSAAAMPGVFVAISALNGYAQSFAMPAIIKISAAWFDRTGRATFAAIFTILSVTPGLMLMNWLGRLLLAGFAIFGWPVPPLHWRWLFWVPAVLLAMFAVPLWICVKDTPEQAGFNLVESGPGSEALGQGHASVRESFFGVVRDPLVWFFAVAYALGSGMAQTLSHWALLYFREQLLLERQMLPGRWALAAMFAHPVGLLLGALVSDKLFRGRRAPVAAGAYFLLTAAIVGLPVCGQVAGIRQAWLGGGLMALVALVTSAVRPVIGMAAAMDIGGRKASAFAYALINAVPWMIGGVAGVGMPTLLRKAGWLPAFGAMAAMGVLAGTMMLVATRKERLPAGAAR